MKINDIEFGIGNRHFMNLIHRMMNGVFSTKQREKEKSTETKERARFCFHSFEGRALFSFIKFIMYIKMAFTFFPNREFFSGSRVDVLFLFCFHDWLFSQKLSMVAFVKCVFEFMV